MCMRFSTVNYFASIAAASLAMTASAVPSPERPFEGPPDFELAAVGEAEGLKLGDLNGDGRPDFIVLSGETDALLVLLGQPGPKLATAPPVEIAAGKSASDFALGDLNQDGKLDLAVSHHDTDEVWLFFGDGRGGFRSPEKIQVPVSKPHCHALEAADLNGDGHLDLVFTEADANSVWLLLGDGRGKFAPAPGTPIPTDRHPYVVRVADFNRDGHPDLATPNWFGKSLDVLLGDGTGRFRAAPAGRVRGLQQPSALAAGDLSGDGFPDLVVGNNGAHGLQIFVGDGKGGFRKGAELDPAAPCFGPVLADLNGDGKLDVLATSTGDAQTLSYWINRGDGKFGPAQTLPCPNGANTLQVADANGDGLPDLCVGPWKTSSLRVWLGRR